MNTNEKNIYIDPAIPLEQQIAFLRRIALNFQLNTFDVLKEKLGSEGVEIFKTILKRCTKQGINKIKEKSFEVIKNSAGVPDRILGLHVKQDHTGPDEFQYTITFCPYLEESLQRGMDMDFCNIIEEVQIEEVSRHIGEMTEPSRMCRGDRECIIKVKNTLG